jgi:hypothetical protein
MVNVRYKIVNRDFLMVFICVDIALEYRVQGLFCLHSDAVSFPGGKADDPGAGGIKADPGILQPGSIVFSMIGIV